VIELQYWHPLFVSLREHPRNATQEEAWKRVSSQRLIPSGQRSGPQNNHPTTNIRRASTSNGKNQKTQTPPEQPAAQAEAPPMNTSAPSTQPPLQHQETKTQEGQQQDSEEEIEAIIEDELACLRQENERLRLMQEQLARRKAMAKRAQTMQQQLQ
jgi:hypothetical protein